MIEYWLNGVYFKIRNIYLVKRNHWILFKVTDLVLFSINNNIIKSNIVYLEQYI